MGVRPHENIWPAHCFSGGVRTTENTSAAGGCPPQIFPPLERPIMLKNRKGFTLIELLIVVVIIGILAAIAIPKFANTKEKAYYTAMKSDLRNLMTAEEAYFSDS